jgi:tetratricopeptide (TPR) repeat protein
LLGENSVLVVSTLENLGLVYFTMEQLEQAEPYLARAVAIRKATLGDEHPFYANALGKLGATLAGEKKLPEAEMLFREAVEVQRKLYGNQVPAYAEALIQLGRVLAEQGSSLVEAELMTMHALLVTERAQGQESINLAPCFENMARIHLARKEHEAAKFHLRRCLSLYSKSNSPDTIPQARALERYIQLMKQVEDGDDVTVIEARVADIRSKTQQR